MSRSYKSTDHNGWVYFRLKGELHHEDGPAVISPAGTKSWYQNGLRHRIEGPAIELYDRINHEYWINGKKIDIDSKTILTLDQLETYITFM